MDSVILITVDVEDWFQVENLKPWIPRSTWGSRELRVERNTHLLLDLFDSFNGQRTTDYGPASGVSATFFILGWIAERLPGLVREIQARGHEVASHGYGHELCATCPPDTLEKDMRESKKLLEDMIGAPVLGYRAPGFSISWDILRLIEDSGYMYDSSYNSFAMNKRYGQVGFKGKREGIAYELGDAFYELPVSNIRLWGHVLPWGGGGYFRLYPFALFKKGVEAILEKDNAYLFYIHPWEVDPEQPKVKEASVLFRFRHYINLEKTKARMSSFLNCFPHSSFVSCGEFLSEITKGGLTGSTGSTE